MADRIAFAELHCHTNFSFLDGASAPDELVERAVALGLTGLAVTDHQGLYGVVRFATAAAEAGIHPVIGVEIELVDAAAPDPGGLVVPARRASRRRGRSVPGTFGSPGPLDGATLDVPTDGRPARPRPARTRLPGHRATVKEDLRGVGTAVRGPHLVLLARDATGYRSLCRLVSRANMAGTKGVPRFSQALLAEHAEGLVALSGCRGSWPATAKAPGRSRSGTPGSSAVARVSAGQGGVVATVGRSPRRASSSSSSTTWPWTTTGSWRRRRDWPRSLACRSS